MPTAPTDEATIREQAYYLREQDGRPDGRDNEYWMRATVAAADKGQLDTLTSPAPKKAAKQVPTLKSAASKSKTAPAKAEAAKKSKKK